LAYVNEDVQRAGDEDLLSVLLCGAAHKSIKLAACQFRKHGTVLAEGVEALEALD
jgi:cobalamin biosynthesis protein CbiD